MVAEYEKGECVMSKEEIALELTKLSYDKYVGNKVTSSKDGIDVEKEVANLYNYIYENLKVSEQNR